MFFVIRYLTAIVVVGYVLNKSSIDATTIPIWLFFNLDGLIIVLIPTLFLSSIGSDMNKSIMFNNMKDNSIRFGWIGFLCNLVITSFSVGQYRIPMENIPGIFGLQFGIGSISLLYGYLFGYLIFEPLRKYYS